MIAWSEAPRSMTTYLEAEPLPHLFPRYTDVFWLLAKLRAAIKFPLLRILLRKSRQAPTRIREQPTPYPELSCSTCSISAFADICITATPPVSGAMFIVSPLGRTSCVALSDREEISTFARASHAAKTKRVATKLNVRRVYLLIIANSLFFVGGGKTITNIQNRVGYVKRDGGPHCQAMGFEFLFILFASLTRAGNRTLCDSALRFL